MQFRRTFAAAGAVAVLVAVGAGCSSSSSNTQSSEVFSDVILGSSALAPSESESGSRPSSSSAPPASLPTASDPTPKVPSGAVMAATVVVDSGRFKGTSKIQSTGTVGCSYSLLGDKQWRINFSSAGEFESKDTTATGRRVISFGVTTQDDGTADLSVSYNNEQTNNDLEDKQGVVVVRDDGTSVTFRYAGRNGDGTAFHGSALCTKPLRSP
jgi:hypothetical protein